MPPRRWTDDDLRRAIGSEKSWQEVAKALGYKPNSTVSIRLMKRRAMELGLSTEHFTAQRTWTYRALRDAVDASMSWSEVVEALGLSPSADSRVRVRGTALRLGIDTRHLDPPPLPEIAEEVRQLLPQQALIRDAAETIAASWFALRGLRAAVPVQRCPYDLVVTFPSGLKRVQVKSSAFKPANGSYVVQIGQRPYVLDKTAGRVPYEPDALDFFFVIDGDGFMYLIPIAAVAGRTAISVGAYRKYIVGSCADILNGHIGAVTSSDTDALMGG